MAVVVAANLQIRERVSEQSISEWGGWPAPKKILLIQRKTTAGGPLRLFFPDCCCCHGTDDRLLLSAAPASKGSRSISLTRSASLPLHLRPALLHSTIQVDSTRRVHIGHHDYSPSSSHRCLFHRFHSR
jgi:hypothetical protein